MGRSKLLITVFETVVSHWNQTLCGNRTGVENSLWSVV